MINKRLFLAGLTTGLLSLSAAFPAMAGSWKMELVTMLPAGTPTTVTTPGRVNGWRWIDGNQDGVSECYYFDAEGWLTSTTTPDGYTVNADGAWTVKRHRSEPPDRGFNEFDNES